MGTSDQYDKGPLLGGAAAGFSAGYARDRKRAEAELRDTIAGPASQPAADNDPEMRNPDGEWEDPAPMSAARPAGSDEAGNSKTGGAIDPQGQQGGTHGGSAARPSLGPTQSDGPLESPDQRKRRSTQLPS